MRRHPVSAGFLYLSWTGQPSRAGLACRTRWTASHRLEASDGHTGDRSGGAAPFTERVLAAGAQCSMDGRGRCLDNVFIERLWRSLKYEAVYLHELTDGFEAERVIGAWMTFYSDVRPHSDAGRGLRRGAGSVTLRAAGSRVRTAGSALNAPPTHCFPETWVVRDIGELAVMPAFRWRPQRSASCPALRSGAEDSRAAERQRCRARESAASRLAWRNNRTDRPHGRRVRQTSLPRHSSCPRRNALSRSSSSTTPAQPAPRRT